MILGLVRRMKLYRTMSCLDMFAGNGSSVGDLVADWFFDYTAWDLDSVLLAKFKVNHPQIHIKATDVGLELQMTPAQQFDVVIIDNFIMGGSGIEHFWLLPYLPRILNVNSAVVLNIFTDPVLYLSSAPPPVRDQVIAERTKVYGEPLPSLEKLIEFYRGYFGSDDIFIAKRNEAVSFLGVKLCQKNWKEN